LRVLGIITNPVGWGEIGLVGGGEIRAVEIFRRWPEWKIDIETLETWPATSLRYAASYIVHELKLPLKRGGALADAINAITWILKGLAPLTKFRRMGKQFNVVIASTSNISDVALAWLSSRLLSSPFIVVFQVTCYNPSLSTTYKMMRGEGNRIVASIFRSLGAVLTLKLSRKASGFICLSKPVADILEVAGFPKNKILINGMGVDLKRVKNAEGKEKEHDAIFLGRVEKSKGIADLLAAWQNITKKRARARLIIVGSGSYLSEAEQLASNLGINENVEFTGFVHDEEKYVYLKKSKLLVFPTKAREGWGMVVAEAMACGLPVVCYDNPALVNVFGDCKSVLFTSTGDVDELSSNILKMLENEKMLKEYSELSKECSKNYDWDVVAKRELEIIKSAV